MTARPSSSDRTHAEAELSAWCPRCRHQVALTNLRPWPEGVLVIGECSECRSALASSRPFGWTGASNGARSAGVGSAG